MHIVVCATSFLPRVGGVENIADMIAHALAVGGDEVTVLTLYDGDPMPERAYRLIRRPDPLTIFRVCRAADAVIMPNIGLKMVLPVLASRTPLFVWHQHEYRNAAVSDKDQTLPTRLKGAIIKRLVAANFGCSDYITNGLPDGRPKATLLNPYDSDIFFEDETVVRDQDILGLGRFVHDKGFHIVLQAMSIPDGPLRTARVTLVGEGPDEQILKDMVVSLGIADRVAVLGAQRGEELRRTLCAHHVLVVPSIWQEPFGIVALEGLACGCATVVSNAGGLPQAVGGQGLMFELGNAADAAQVLASARAEPRIPDPAARRAHLANHTCAAVAKDMRRLVMFYLKRPKRA